MHTRPAVGDGTVNVFATVGNAIAASTLAGAGPTDVAISPDATRRT
ncbi:hypothetical protein ACFW1M_29345 [Streptomyces inhibens]